MSVDYNSVLIIIFFFWVVLLHVTGVFLELPGVVQVIPNSLHKLQTTRSWDFLGLSSHSTNNVLHKSKMGDGVIIGVLDSGSLPSPSPLQSYFYLSRVCNGH
jgi:hypothetical protein